MILQSLKSYYDRMIGDSDTKVAPPGFYSQRIHFALVIERDGKVKQVKDLREGDDKKKSPVDIIVPEPVKLKRTANVEPNFLWDNSSYVLGIESIDEGLSSQEKEKRISRVKKYFDSFKSYHKEMADKCEDIGLKAVVAFLESWKAEMIEEIDYAEEIPGANIVFILDEDGSRFIHQRPEVIDFWINYKSGKASEVIAECLITGERSSIARIHQPIKGVTGAQTTGAAIVSFNIESFKSYNKTQNFNAPVSEKAAFAYTTALNYLLKSERQRMQLGETTIVFWTERRSPVEDILGFAINPEIASASDQGKIRDFLRAAKNAERLPDNDIDPDVMFYILGISPNASRLAIRFFHASTVGDIKNRIGEHFCDIEITRNYPDSESEYPGLWRLIRETAVQKKSDNINPLLAGSLTRSIFTGGDYPRAILTSTLVRIKADGDINYYRACLIKGYLSRYNRIRNIKWEVSMSLNNELVDAGYRLGRLFAVLEKVQQDANPGLNTTIKDRYFSSASATPRVVFPQLMRLSQHHMAKLTKINVGLKVEREKLLQEIVDVLPSFPSHLNLESQGMFALGYYQQRKDLFTSKKNKEGV